MRSNSETEPRYFDRLLPPKSFRRTVSITALSITAMVGALHYEFGRLQQTQETKIGEVKEEVTTQGNNIQAPLIARVDEANKSIAEGSEKLGICEDVARQLGVLDNNQAVSPESTTSTTMLVTNNDNMAAGPATSITP